MFYLALDPQGRRVAVYRGSDAYAKEVYQYHVGGAAEATGPAGSGLTSSGYSAVLFREREPNVVSAYEKYDYAASASARADDGGGGGHGCDPVENGKVGATGLEPVTPVV